MINNGHWLAQILEELKKINDHLGVDEIKQLREQINTGKWLTDKYLKEILHLKEKNKQLHEQLKEYIGDEEE